jgi:protein-S-isoprenylcysteine O-methyltransferase Ste14
MIDYVVLIFIIDMFALLVLLIGIIWSVAVPKKRIWPPPSKRTWQYATSWTLFYLVFGLNTFLMVFDWNTWFFNYPLRFTVGIPFALIGSSLLIWAIRTLGTRNTSGISDGFIKDGPYRFTRNPQYLGDMLLFIGLSIMVNSLYLWVTHILLILVFIITPLAEEVWLEDQYGDSYRNYLESTSRFL